MRYFAYAESCRNLVDPEPKVGDLIEAKQYFPGCERIPPRMALEVVSVDATAGRIEIAPVFRTNEVIGSTWDPANFILYRRPSL